MMAKTSKTPFKKRFKARKIHFALSYVAATILSLLLVTGVLLNHTEDFQLNQVKIHNSWLLNWYNIDQPTVNKAYPVQQNWLSEVGNGTTTRLYWNQIPLPEVGQNNAETRIRQLLIFNQFIALLQPKTLTLLTLEGDIIERLPLPKALYASETSETSAPQFVTTPQQDLWLLKNHQAWWLNEDFTGLAEMAPPNVTKPLLDVSTQTPPQSLMDQIQSQFDSPLTLEQLILELHNGFFFGKIGPYLLDIFALILFTLIFTGIRLHLKK